MSIPVSELGKLLRTMEPQLHPGVYVFVSLPPGEPMPAVEPLATFREVEGLSLILPEQDAVSRGLAVLFRAAWISLEVHSDLEAVGLTAAVAAALTHRGISCNVVAGTFHDHLFVPVDRADEALECLRRLQGGERAPGEPS